MQLKCRPHVHCSTTHPCPWLFVLLAAFAAARLV
jgi:hypothetical protein